MSVVIEKAVATKVNGKTAVELSEAGVKALKAFNKAKASEAKAKAIKAKAEAILRAELGEAADGWGREQKKDGCACVKVLCV